MTVLLTGSFPPRDHRLSRTEEDVGLGLGYSLSPNASTSVLGSHLSNPADGSNILRKGVLSSGRSAASVFLLRLVAWEAAMLEKTERSALSDQRPLSIRRIDAIPVALPLKTPMKMAAETVTAAQNLQIGRAHV